MAREKTIKIKRRNYFGLIGALLFLLSPAIVTVDGGTSLGSTFIFNIISGSLGYGVGYGLASLTRNGGRKK